MRILLTTLPLMGHFYPLVPMAWSLRCAGDEVMVATTSRDFVENITGAGLPVAVVRDIPQSAYARASVIVNAGGPVERDLEVSACAWARLAGMALPDMRDLIRTFQPDLVISEPAEFSARIAASQEGVPWVEHSWGLPSPGAYLAAAQAQLSNELAQAGVAGLGAADFVIHPSPAGLWPSGSRPGTSMRYIPYNGQVRHQPLARRDRGRPRALVTFGSLLVEHGTADKRALLRETLRELSEDGWELVVGMPPSQARDFLPMPANVIHAGWVPLTPALSACDLIVHHGGTGTAMAAATAGVPQVILPSATDQFGTAAALHEYGAAIRIMPDAASAAAVREGALLATDGAVRDRARELAADIAELPSPHLIAALLPGRREGHRHRLTPVPRPA